MSRRGLGSALNVDLAPPAVRSTRSAASGVSSSGPGTPLWLGSVRLTVDRLLRPEQAAWYLNVKTSWVYEAVRSGLLPCRRVGRHIRFTRSMLDEWLAEQPQR